MGCQRQSGGLLGAEGALIRYMDEILRTVGWSRKDFKGVKAGSMPIWFITIFPAPSSVPGIQ